MEPSSSSNCDFAAISLDFVIFAPVPCRRSRSLEIDVQQQWGLDWCGQINYKWIKFEKCSLLVLPQTIRHIPQSRSCQNFTTQPNQPQERNYAN